MRPWQLRARRRTQFGSSAPLKCGSPASSTTCSCPCWLDGSTPPPAALRDAFEAEYARLYHAVLDGYEPLVLNWRLRALGPQPGVRLPKLGAVTEGARRGRRRAYFPESGGHVETPVLDRYRLRAGERVEGPAIVEERESTTVIGPGDVLRVDRSGSLRIQVGRR